MTVIEKIQEKLLEAAGVYCFPLDNAVALHLAKAAVEALRAPRVPGMVQDIKDHVWNERINEILSGDPAI